MKNKEENKIIVVNTETEFGALKHNETLSHQFDSITTDAIHFKNLNFNYLEISTLKKIKSSKIIFENCILGNLHYIDFNRTKEIHLINQYLDNYFINTVHPRKLFFEKIHVETLPYLSKKHYETLSFKNCDINNKISQIEKIDVSQLYLEGIEKYSLTDLIYLRDKLNDKKISKLFFNDTEIDSKKLFFIERKIKIQKLIDDNA